MRYEDPRGLNKKVSYSPIAFSAASYPVLKGHQKELPLGTLHMMWLLLSGGPLKFWLGPFGGGEGGGWMVRWPPLSTTKQKAILITSS